MNEDPKMSEMTQQERNTALAFDREDWAALGLAFLALGALVIATKPSPEKATIVATR